MKRVLENLTRHHHGFAVNTSMLHFAARAVFKEMMWRYEGIRWPSTRLSLTTLLPFLYKRMNEASGNYQMFAVLGDVIIPQELVSDN